MELLKAIEIADCLCPNPYTQKEKLRWCQELSALIRKEVKKVYDTVETCISDWGEVIIPDGISFDDIEAAYINGKYMSKLDLRSFTTEPVKNNGTVVIKLVYLTHPEPVREICISGEYDLSENFLKIHEPPFVQGDKLEYVILEEGVTEADWSKSDTCQVLECVYDGLMMTEDCFVPQTAAKMVIRRITDDITETDGDAYDGIYVEYLLAKMALYQHDYTGYNAHMLQYNNMYDGLRRDYRSRAPLNGLSVFKNFWSNI